MNSDNISFKICCLAVENLLNVQNKSISGRLNDLFQQENRNQPPCRPRDHTQDGQNYGVGHPFFIVGCGYSRCSGDASYVGHTCNWQPRHMDVELPCDQYHEDVVSAQPNDGK